MLYDQLAGSSEGGGASNAAAYAFLATAVKDHGAVRPAIKLLEKVGVCAGLFLSNHARIRNAYRAYILSSPSKVDQNTLQRGMGCCVARMREQRIITSVPLYCCCTAKTGSGPGAAPHHIRAQSGSRA